MNSACLILKVVTGPRRQKSKIITGKIKEEEKERVKKWEK